MASCVRSSQEVWSLFIAWVESARCFSVWQGLFGVTSHPSKAFLLQVDALFRVVASRGMLLSQRKSFDVAIGPYYFGTTAAEQFVVADPGFACAAAQPPADGHRPDP